MNTNIDVKRQEELVGSSASAGSVGAPPPKPSNSDGDNALYRAMLSETLELGTLADAQTSVAELSTALYNHMVPYATDKLKSMQHDLGNYTWLQEHFDEFAAYFSGTGPKPALGPGMTPEDLAQIKAFYEAHPTEASSRGAIGSLAQEINVQNTYVQDTKVIPQGLENDVQNLASAQAQAASFIPSTLSLMSDQEAQPW